METDRPVAEVLGSRVIELERQLRDSRDTTERLQKENTDLHRRIDRINEILDKSLKNTREALDLVRHIQATTDVNLTKLNEVEKAKRFF